MLAERCGADLPLSTHAGYLLPTPRPGAAERALGDARQDRDTHYTYSGRSRSRLLTLGNRCLAGSPMRERKGVVTRSCFCAVVILLIAWQAGAQLHPEVLPAGRVGLSGTYLLRKVTVIDGTGGPAKRDQAILIEAGSIKFVGSADRAPLPPNAQILDLPGRTVIPGLVAMHEHMVEANGTTPRLLLANGVTTARLAGADRPFLELATRRWIREGRIPGPELFLTAPFVSEPFENLVRYRFVILHELTSEKEAREFVRYWAAAGFDAIKVYRGVRAEMLRVLVDEARRNDIYVLGHIQRVTCLEAARAGMRSLEHGLSTCVDDLRDADGREVRDPESAVMRERFSELIRLGMTITETPVDLSPLTEKELDVLHVGARAEYDRLSANHDLGPGALPGSEDQAPAGMTVAFFRGGGRVMLGADSSGVPRIPGFANLRALRLLYTAYGFDPLEAIRIAALEGARFLGIDDRTGTAETGKEADLVVLRGDPTARFADVENIELVFSNGALFYPKQLLGEVRGQHLRQN